MVEEAVSELQITFEGVLGQATAQRFLQQVVRQGRLAHSYLFFGPDGVGKVALAMAFARVLLCESDAARPCGSCQSCVWYTAGNHPNLKILFPYPKSAREADVQEVLRTIREQPYSLLRPWASPAISIDAVRALRKDLGLRDPGGRNRVILIVDAHQMTAEATNALLKTLEEPPEATYFILTTAAPDLLLPTVLSRCQQVRFSLLSYAEIEEGLAQLTELEAQERHRLARLAQGSMRRALELAGEDLRSLREAAVELLRAAFRSPPQRAKHVLGLLQEYDRKQQVELLESLIYWLRDAETLALLGEETGRGRIANADDLETLLRFVERFPEFAYLKAVEEVESAVHMLQRYVQPLTVFLVLLDRLRRCERKAPAQFPLPAAGALLQ